MLPTYALLDAIIIASAVTCVSWRRLAQDVREKHSLAGADAAAAAHTVSSSTAATAAASINGTSAHASAAAAAPASEVSVELPPVK